jgi:hypothetical protein
MKVFNFNPMRPFFALLLFAMLFAAGGFQNVQASQTLSKLCQLLSIPRVHAEEYCESACLSESLRSRVFEALTGSQAAAGVVKVIHETFQEALGDSKWPSRRVVELGSGSGQMMLSLAREFQNHQFVMTDLYPQRAKWSEYRLNNLSFANEAVDLSKVESTLRPYVQESDTVFLSAVLHHMKPEWVQVLLKLAAEKKLRLLILEPFDRDIKGLAVGAGAGFLSMAVSKAAWQDYKVPLIMSHDGVLSALRQYRQKELLAMATSLGLNVTEKKGLGPLKNYRVMTIAPQ